MTIALSDTFTDADGTSLSAHTMNVGSGWTLHSGTWTIQSNHAESELVDGRIATAAGGISDGVLTCDIAPYDSGATASLVGVVFRYVDTSNFWLVQADSRLDTLTLFRNLAGSFTSQGTSAPVMSSLTSYALSITLSGTSIVVTLNGANTISITNSSHQTATRYGLRYGKTSAAVVSCQWDNFLLDDGAAVGQPTALRHSLMRTGARRFGRGIS